MANKQEKKDNNETKKKTKIIIPVFILLLLTAGAVVGVQFGANLYAERKLNELAAQTGYNVTWSKVQTNLINRTATVSDMVIKIGDGEFKSPKIVFSRYKGGQFLPQNIVMSISQFNIPVTKSIFKHFYEPLNHMGYEQLTGSGVFSVSLRLDGQLDLVTSRLAIDHLGVLDTRFTVANVETQSFPLFLRTLPSKNIVSGWISFADSGFTSQVVATFTIDAKVAVEDSRDRILFGLNRRMQTEYTNDSPERRALAQLYRYFENPNKLTITIDESRGAKLSQFVPPNSAGWRELAVWFVSLPQDMMAN